MDTLAQTRQRWVDWTVRLGEPVLEAVAARQLKARMPIETPGDDREAYTHLEAVGRLLTGIAPWLALDADLPTVEAQARDRFRSLAQSAIAAITDPASADYCNWEQGRQPCVDAAFLAEAMLRAPKLLYETLPATVQANLVDSLRRTRVCMAADTNWLLFKAIIEAALYRFTGEYQTQPVDYALQRHAQWYVGDGVYGDGPHFHADYYNSFVIQPMLLEVLETMAGQHEAWDAMLPAAVGRAQRGAAILERLIAPDGSFPPIGRSLCYRGGAFHLLALMALRGQLPDPVAAAQVRCGLTAVLQRTLDAPGTFDDAGWLRLGLAGSQPGLAEFYISTGSLYLCSAALLPLGLPLEAPFWSSPAEPWTSRRIWSGDNHTVDKALQD